MRYFRRLLALLAAVALMTMLSACNYKSHYQKSNYDYASRAANDPKMTHVRSYGNTTGNPKQHENKYFEYSSAVSNKVADLPGINTAIVFLTDKNAYVGILTDWTATGTRARGGPREQDNSGTTEGVYNVSNGSSKWDNRQVATPYNSYFSHKDYTDLSTELRQVIGNTVRDMHQRVEEVHISANREYVNQSLEFAKAAWSNKSLSELTPAFNRLVQYTFGYGNAIPLPLSDGITSQKQPNR
ncbi:YhcN/YlaJ family sporulation lipoprotein [Cohnella yongneupensis]|uniref:YhcN/YlaJ family sporulation lipoprotein n=1 Tax=Cohnella yongneupensis TaxID=425006 RepID=A0ABW0R2Y4_9BACL